MRAPGNNARMTGRHTMKIQCSAVAAAAACALLASCGGNGGDDNPGPPAGAQTFPQVAPNVGSLDFFAVVTTDEAGNDIVRGYEERVTKSGSDGSYELAQDDPGAGSVTVNGVLYRYDPTVRDFGGSSTNYAQAKSVTTLPDTTTPTTCTYQGGGHPRPLFVGQTWSTSYTVSCDGGTVTTYTNTGGVDAVESIAVYAGNFTALRTHDTITWTTHDGEIVVETVQAWIDPAHAFFTLKNITTYTRTGTVPVHHVVSTTTELQSRQ